MFLFRKTRRSTLLGLSLALFLFTMLPQMLKTLSLGTEVVGMDKYFLASSAR
jgi:hypothetical protein